MVLTLLEWLTLLALCWVFGLLAQAALERWLRFSTADLPLPDVALLGLALLSALANLASLGLAMNLGTAAAAAAAGIISAVFLRKRVERSFRQAAAQIRRSSPWALALGSLSVLFALFRSSGAALNYDTGLYHAQVIRWAETFPAVPGLGNLFDRLAFNSSWHVLSALFSLAGLGLGSFHTLNGFLYVVFILLCLNRAGAFLRGRFFLAGAAGLLFIFLSRYLFSLELSSPGTDLPAALLVWTVFLLCLERLEQAQDRSWDISLGALLAYSCFAVSIKVSAAPVLLLPAFFWARTTRPHPWLAQPWLAAAVCSAVLLPWLARGVVLSGYLLYPLSFTGVPFTSWQVPRVYVAETARAITAWARLPGQDSARVLSLPLMDWLPEWWRAQQIPDRRLVYALAAAALFAPFGLLRCGISLPTPTSAQPENTGKNALWLLAASAAGLAYWFLQAPAFRFGYTFLAPALVLLTLFGARVMRRPPFYRHAAGLLLSALLAGGLCLYMLAGLAGLRNISSWKAIALLPAAYPAVETRLADLGGFQVHMPTHLDQCWYAAIPCTPIHNPEVSLRADNFSEGFYNRVQK
jgi:hypothetical protein